MTEVEWLTCADPQKMLGFLGEASERKLRLFGVACCRRAWHQLADGRSRRAVEVAERLADGRATGRERSRADEDNAWVWSEEGVDDLTSRLATGVGYCLEPRLGRGDVWPSAIRQASWFLGEAVPPADQAALLRDVFGPLPFRTLTVDPGCLSWHGGLVASMARRMSESREFAEMSVLADALEEAGCANPEVLSHSRQQDGVHVRGCWVVDGILGKR